MEFRQLEAFAAIAKYKSFSKAANALYLTQPTISAHLGSLERELQKKLVSRTTKTIQLTQDGEKFLKYVNRILELKEAAVQELAGEEKEIISLGASTIPSGYLLPGLLSEFRRQHPGVFFQIRQGDSCEIEEKVTDGTVELGLVGSSCDLPECICTKFCSDSMVIAMPCTSYYMNLKRQAEKTGDIRMFFSEPFIMREIGSGTRKAAGEFLEKMGIREENLNVAARINKADDCNGHGYFHDVRICSGRYGKQRTADYLSSGHTDTQEVLSAVPEKEGKKTGGGQLYPFCNGFL